MMLRIGRIKFKPGFERFGVALITWVREGDDWLAREAEFRRVTFSEWVRVA